MNEPVEGVDAVQNEGGVEQAESAIPFNGFKWVFRLKNPDGSIYYFKARVVAKGYTQKTSIHYTETFILVVRFITLGVLLAITALEDLEMDQVDLKYSYLNGEIGEEVYVKLPDRCK